MAEVENIPVAEETPTKEQAPAEEPLVEEGKDLASKEEAGNKKSVFAAFCGCFGGKSQVVHEKPVAQEQAKEKDQELDEPVENKTPENEPAKAAESEE